MTQFKPMLAPNQSVDLDTIKYPILISGKLDGIRCIFKNGEMLSRSLKQIRNKKLQERFNELKQYSKDNNLVLDGEIYSHELTFQEITHFVMTEDIGDEVLPESLNFWCFDVFDENRPLPFFERVEIYDVILTNKKYCVRVEQIKINSREEIQTKFDKMIDNGYEGLIIKDLDGLYKCGRGTLKEGLIYKMKPFKTYDLAVIDVFERMENTSESTINELGRSQKSRHKDDLIPTGIAGGFVVEYQGKSMKVTLTGNEEFRRDIWTSKEKCIGKVIELKAMEVGSKDVLRHPVFLRFRDDK